MIDSIQQLQTTLDEAPHEFLRPTPQLHNVCVAASKTIFDSLITEIKALQDAVRSVKRRRRRQPEQPNSRPLQIQHLHTEEFQWNQIWAQIQLVLDAARDVTATRQHLRRNVVTAPDTADGDIHSEDIHSEDIHSEDIHSEDIHSEDEDMIGEETVGWEDENSNDGSGNEIFDDNSENGLPDGNMDSADVNEQDEADMDSADVNEQDEADMDSADVNEQDKADMDSAEGFEDEMPDDEDADETTYVPDQAGLNDGFFSIDAFNKQSELLEQQDSRAEAEASDDESIDWTHDPLDHAAEDTSSDSEDVADMSENANTNDIRYADFFAPPARKVAKTDRRPLPKTQPAEPTEHEMQRTMASVHRDIFEDDLTPEEGATDDRSAHENRQAKLRAEIQRLEAAAVAKRDWTLSGEARAAERPVNSLLEEDLDFERAGKPIPVITQEVSEDIEALIKRRILQREFDEVIRRRPQSLAETTRRGRVDVSTSKSQQSLAEIYEKEHQEATNPELFADKRSDKLKAEHARIEDLWRDVCGKLDALSSMNYRPKAPQISVNVMADVPTIAMEEVRPDVGLEGTGESRLAPQELYKAGQGNDKTLEITTKAGMPVAREEMSREEKLRRRRRAKERIRKAGSGVVKRAPEGKSARRAEREGIVGDLKKGGVKVIGKKGELTDVQGRTVGKVQRVKQLKL